MTITKRQFNHLNEMGINVWQQRNTSTLSELDKIKSPHRKAILPIDSSTLTQYVIFTDILQCLTLSIGEVNIEKSCINLGLFNWQFIETESITFTQNTLNTPVLSKIVESNTLKKDLWLTIQQEVLTR